MKTSIKSIHAMKGNLLIKTLFACLIVAAFSFAAIPTWAGDAEDNARKAFDVWEKSPGLARPEVSVNTYDNSFGLPFAAPSPFPMNGIETLKQLDKKSEQDLKDTLEELRSNKVHDYNLACSSQDYCRDKIALIKAKLTELGMSFHNSPFDLLGKESCPPVTASLENGNGLQTATFATLQGRILVNLPDDIRAGDTISGTVITEPKGDTAEEKAKNQSVLNGTVIDLEGTKIQAGRPTFTWTAPVSQSGAPPRYLLKIIFQGQDTPYVIQSSQMATVNPKTPPDPNVSRTFNIPPLGQTGRPIVITGPFDGNSSNTTINAASAGFSSLAESPREAVVRNLENVTGPIQITVKEGDKQTTGAFRNVGVDLTAPKTSLMKGESTELHVEVNGLQGIKEPVPLTLESHGVITMVGGMYQQLTIQPSQVGADGRYSTTRGVTGMQAGAWGTTATVVTKPFNICLQDDSGAGTLLLNSFTGRYLFNPPAGPYSERIERLFGGPPATGSVTIKGCMFALEDNRADRRVHARIDMCASTGTGDVWVANSPAKSPKFTITDRDTRNNTSACK